MIVHNVIKLSSRCRWVEPRRKELVVQRVCQVFCVSFEKIILDDGWALTNVRGSHHQYEHPTKTGKVTIPNHRGDIPQRVVNSILKQAGL